MEFVNEFMTERFMELPDHYVKIKTMWRSFCNTSQYLNTSKSNRKRKNDEMKYSEFVEIVKELYPQFYKKEHWKYGKSLFMGAIKDRWGEPDYDYPKTELFYDENLN